MTKKILAIDAGTTGVTSILFDENLAVLKSAYREFPQHFPQPGWVEHDASEILHAVDQTTAEVAQGVDRLDAIGITNQRETVFALDIVQEKALGRGIVWQDRRTSAFCQELKDAGHERLVKQRTGLLLDPYFSGTKVHWMLQHVPGVRERAEAGAVRFATVDALIAWHLTKNCKTDFSNASRTLLFDIDERRWDPELCALFGVDPSWLPDVGASSSHFGDARIAGLEAPLFGIAGDQQSALFGQGCWDAGTFKNTYGTGCFLVLNTGAERVDSERGLLTTLAADASGAPCYALEGSVFSAGLVLQWLRDQLGIITNAAESETLAASVDDTGGVFLVPAFAGLGAPYWDADARGALLGLTRGTNRAHIVRAALEGIAFQCAEIVELFRSETGMPIDELLVDGGASANGLLMQMQADLAGLRIRRPRNVETTARGAAALAGLGAGAWSELSDVSAFSEGHTTYVPELESVARRERLAQWGRAVQRVRSD